MGSFIFVSTILFRGRTENKVNIELFLLPNLNSNAEEEDKQKLLGHSYDLLAAVRCAVRVQDDVDDEEVVEMRRRANKLPLGNYE